MKRIITFAIMALLIGGFTINADAQNKGKKNSSSSTTGTVLSSQEIDPMLNNFESALNKCESVNTKLQKVEKRLSDLAKVEKSVGAGRPARKKETKVINNSKFNPTQSSTDTKSKLESERAELLKEYNAGYYKTKALKNSLSKSLNNMSADQTNRYNTLLPRWQALPNPD